MDMKKNTTWSESPIHQKVKDAGLATAANIHCSDQSGSLLDKCATDRMADEISDYLTYGMHHSTQEAKSRISEIIRGENK